MNDDVDNTMTIRNLKCRSLSFKVLSDDTGFFLSSKNNLVSLQFAENPFFSLNNF